MANSNNVPSPVLPLPPLEYDFQYFNNLIRLINYYIEQKDNPGRMRGSALELSDGTTSAKFVADVLAYDTGETKLIVTNLPTSATGLASGQIWRDGTSLKIVP